MRKRNGFAVAVLATILILATAVPAAAATRIRVYKGTTSQDNFVKFHIVKNDRGRFVRQFDVGFTLTCEDGTTQEWYVGWGFGRGLPLSDGVLLEFDEVSPSEALHFHGRIGHNKGTGTLRWTAAALTADEQAQLCTTGDLTWAVEYVRTITREGDGFFRGVDGVTKKLGVGEDGQVLTKTIRS